MNRGEAVATIYDVARSAGVSAKTVSRVLNGDGPVNTKTRAAIEAAMDSLAYIPSSAARTMRSARSGLVGLLTGAISGSPTGGEPSGLPELQIVKGIQTAFAGSGLTLLIADTGGDPAAVPALVRTLRQHRVEGLFFVADYHRPVDLPASAGAGPLVLVNCHDSAGTPCVLPDDRRGQAELVAALLAAGHRRVAFVTLPEGRDARALRLDGYRDALEAAGIGYDPDLVILGADRSGGPDEAAALNGALDRLLALPAPPTVIACGNDRLAVGIYGILRARGIAVPGAMSVAGYDDYRVISETLYPQLTTMELPYFAMGQAAAGRMVAALRPDDAATPDGPVRVRGALRWRASVAPART